VITVVAFELCVCPARRQSQDLDAAALLFSFSLDFVLFLLPNRVINDAKKLIISWLKEELVEKKRQPTKSANQKNNRTTTENQL